MKRVKPQSERSRKGVGNAKWPPTGPREASDFDDVYGAQASIYKALGYCLIFEGKPFFKCRVETAREAVLKESEERNKS